MIDIKQIIQGYGRLLSNDMKSAILAEERQKLCAECPFKTLANTCSKCGCYIPAKTRSDAAECPDGKWGAVKLNEL
jgi:hypothetical protein